MKTIIRQRIKGLTSTLKRKELEFKEDCNFNFCTQELIDLIVDDLRNLEVFLDLASNDSLVQTEVNAKFGHALNLIEKRIAELQIIEMHSQHMQHGA